MKLLSYTYEVAPASDFSLSVHKAKLLIKSLAFSSNILTPFT
jgi:hypothetical protein